MVERSIPLRHVFLYPEGRITKKELIDFILKETEGFSDDDLVSSIHMRFLMIGKAIVREIASEQDL